MGYLKLIMSSNRNNSNSDGFLNKQKKSFSKFKNNKRRFSESAEMQDNRAKRVNFKSYLRDLEESEYQEELDNLNEN